MNSQSMLQLVQDVNQVRRKVRNPVHPHLVEYRPFQLQPFMIAPVLPGETLKQLSAQARVITDPLKGGAGNILPWWCEHFYFYVKVRQLGDTVRAAFEAMVLDGTPIAINDAAQAETFHNGGTIDWVKHCLHFVTENGGFRDDGEAWNVATLGNLPIAAAHRRGQSFIDSMMVDNDGSAPPSNNHQNPHDPRVLAEYQEQYERMRAMRMIDMTFEDWLQTYGVTFPSSASLERPELIRLSSEWAYPANTVDPATGLPTGAASFAVNIRADKDRFFNEPGFIFGVTMVRPKIFLGNQTGAAVQMMNTPLPWMPRLLADQPHTTVKEFVGGASTPTGPLRGQTKGYWLDTRDLFTHGDQFIAFAAANGFAPALPAANGEYRFLTAAQIDAMFAAAGKNKVRQDGVTRLSILGHPTTSTDMT